MSISFPIENLRCANLEIWLVWLIIENPSICDFWHWQSCRYHIPSHLTFFFHIELYFRSIYTSSVIQEATNPIVSFEFFETYTMILNWMFLRVFLHLAIGFTNKEIGTSAPGLPNSLIPFLQTRRAATHTVAGWYNPIKCHVWTLEPL